MAKINNYQNKEENIKTIMPLFCPQCNKLMNSKLDKKM
jgi:hypothetical protein